MVSNNDDHQISVFNNVTHTYINDERLSSATTTGTVYSMAYDALGRCVKRSISGGPATYYITTGKNRYLNTIVVGCRLALTCTGKRLTRSSSVSRSVLTISGTRTFCNRTMKALLRI